MRFELDESSGLTPASLAYHDGGTFSSIEGHFR